MPDHFPQHYLAGYRTKCAAVDAVGARAGHEDLTALRFQVIDPLDQLAVQRVLEDNHIARADAAQQDRQARNQHEISILVRGRKAVFGDLKDLAEHGSIVTATGRRSLRRVCKGP